MTKREAFVALMEMLGETFNRPMTAGLLEGYWMALEDVPEADLKIAVQKALAAGKFMPAPSELLAFARPRRAVAVDSALAWQAVRKAIDEYDYLVGSIDFGPLVNAVIRNLGGWDTMCKATLPELDNPGWLRKRFDEIYRSLATVEPTALHGDPLGGAPPPNYRDAKHPVVAIDGQPVRLRLEASGQDNASIAEHIRRLADGKSA
jgi:hypothetical protein